MNSNNNNNKNNNNKMKLRKIMMKKMRKNQINYMRKLKNHPLLDSLKKIKIKVLLLNLIAVNQLDLIKIMKTMNDII